MALTDKFEDNLQETLNDVKVPEEKEKNVNSPEEEAFDGVIDLSATRKKRFHVNRGSNSEGVLLLDTSDMSIINRLEKLYPKLEELSQEASLKQLNTKEEDDEKILHKTSQALSKIDSKMRNIVDEIFDSNVSEVCAPSGSMFDPFNGQFRYEHIIETLVQLYKTNVNTEFKKISLRLRKHTSKYTGKR